MNLEAREKHQGTVANCAGASLVIWRMARSIACSTVQVLAVLLWLFHSYLALSSFSRRDGAKGVGVARRVGAARVWGALCGLLAVPSIVVRASGHGVLANTRAAREVVQSSGFLRGACRAALGRVFRTNNVSGDANIII